MADIRRVNSARYLQSRKKKPKKKKKRPEEVTDKIERDVDRVK